MGSRVFLKWAGGKRQLLQEILPELKKQPFNTYFEPFLGGGSVFRALTPKKAVLADLNSNLIQTYQAVAAAPWEVSACLNKLMLELGQRGELHYYQTRLDWNQGLFSEWEERNKSTPVQRAAQFIYLNRAGFNGLYRENGRGEFNVPYGKCNVPSIPSREDLEEVSNDLSNATLLVSSFEGTISKAQAGDLVYCDPPYIPINPASFRKYTREGFGLAEQERLAAMCCSAVERGCTVVLSNSATDLTRQVFAGLGEPQVVQAARLINSKTDSRGKVDEFLFVRRPT